MRGPKKGTAEKNRQKVLIPKLQAILAGSREPGLAADPELHYTDAAEILFLLEKLGK